MQALDDFRQMRVKLNFALCAQQNMRDRTLPQHRRDLATQAYTRACDDMVDLLRRLETDPIVSDPGAKPTMAVVEDMLTGIARCEAVGGA